MSQKWDYKDSEWTFALKFGVGQKLNGGSEIAWSLDSLQATAGYPPRHNFEFDLDLMAAWNIC
jgi:hypothetical protein